MVIFALIFALFWEWAAIGLTISCASETPPSIEMSSPGMESEVQIRPGPPPTTSLSKPASTSLEPGSSWDGQYQRIPEHRVSLRAPSTEQPLQSRLLETSWPNASIRRLSAPSLFALNSAPLQSTSPFLASSARAILIPQSVPIRSLTGQAFNYTFHDLTFTQSTTLQFEQSIGNELEPIEQVDKGTQLVSAVGLAWNSQEQWSLGAHAQIEYDDSEAIHRFVDWLSVRASYSLWEEKLILNFAVYKGINNPDLWFQPELLFHLKEGLSFSLRADIVQNSDDPDQGHLGIFEGQSRIFACMEAQF